MKPSTITKEQWRKVIKAVLYAFVSTFVVTLKMSDYKMDKKTLVAAAVAGVNGVFVTVKQLFTQG